MIENLVIKPTRYLLIDLEGALEEVKAPTESDLIIKKHFKTGNYSILRNGTGIVNLIHALIARYNFKLASHSQKPQKDQLEWFETF